MTHRLLVVLAVVALALPAVAGPTPASPPSGAEMRTDGMIEASGLLQFEGRVAFSKTDLGEVAVLNTASAAYILLPGGKLSELLKTAHLTSQIFLIEGEKVLARDGKSEGLMLKGFTIKAPTSASSTPVASAPVNPQ